MYNGPLVDSIHDISMLLETHEYVCPSCTFLIDFGKAFEFRHYLIQYISINGANSATNQMTINYYQKGMFRVALLNYWQFILVVS